MKKISLLLLLLPLLAAAEEPGPLPAAKVDKDVFPIGPAAEHTERPWFRDVGEYISTRSVRPGISTDPTTKLLTDGQRYDVTVGKRIPVYSWGEESLSEGYAVGVDGGMFASLQRLTHTGRLIFGTNTFDGFFGAWAGAVKDGWLYMFRTAHLSAHLVDNSSNFYNPVSYSQFWNSVIIGKSFPSPAKESDWQLHLQGELGLNNTSSPAAKQPRWESGVDFGYALKGPDSLAFLLSADVLNAGVQGQKSHYSYFAGLGYLVRPQTKHRPLRFGVTRLDGSDHRNQYYMNKDRFTAFEVQAEF